MDELAESHRIDRLTAEFAHPEAEQDFRTYIRASRIRDTRLTIGLAGVLYMAFAYTDYLMLGSEGDYRLALTSRIGVCLVGLVGALLVSRYSRWLLNGVIPTVVVSIAMVDFMLISLWVPYDYGSRGMAIMVMLFGVYAFIPNRYFLSLCVALVATLAFLILVIFRFHLDFGQFVTLAGHLLVTNLMGAMIAYRLSRLMREEYRDQAIVRCANLRLEIEMDERERLEEALRRRAERDDATGIANRSVFFDVAGRMLAEAERGQAPMLLLLVDVDYFKQLNGTYGHMRCDEVLRSLVTVCQAAMTNDSHLARVGGEEFALLVPGGDLLEAGKLAERIRAQCQRTPVAMAEVYVHFTVSIGVVRQRPGEPVDALLRRADEAVSAAKYKGRNRVEVVA